MTHTPKIKRLLEKASCRGCGRTVLLFESLTGEHGAFHPDPVCVFFVEQTQQARVSTRARYDQETVAFTDDEGTAN